jgi:hypothetical protein
MISKLGSNFPEKYRVEFCDKHLVPRAVLRLHTLHANPPKIKRFVIIGINKDNASVGYLYINKRLNPYIKKNPNLYKLQLSLSQENRSYLNRNSYLDCSQIYESSLEYIQKELISDLEIYIGQMSDSDMVKAKRKVRSANTVENKLKRRYGL